MNPAETWLRERLPATPPPLLERMVGALPAAAASVPDALADAALRLYAEVAHGSNAREDALPLLAADALLTHAFQAQAELNPAGVAELATRWGAAGRLGELVGGAAS